VPDQTKILFKVNKVDKIIIESPKERLEEVNSFLSNPASTNQSDVQISNTCSSPTMLP
jgi:hypothetical protein